MAASELPAYIAGLPKLLTENLTINVAGNLNERLDINGYYGGGSLLIDGQGGGSLQKGVRASNCSVRITLSNLEISGHLEIGPAGISNLIVYSNDNKQFTMSNCTVTGSKSADSEGDVGVRADGSRANITNCSISNCGTAVIAAVNSVVSIYNRTGGIFENNDVGPYVYYGGIILLSGTTPVLLGGATSAKAGGLIVKADGTLL